MGIETFGAAKGGKKINPLWGAVVGTGVGTATAIGVRQVAGPASKWSAWSEGIGFGAGALASGAMMLLTKGKRGRMAGYTGMASAFLNNGLRQLEVMLFKPSLGDVVEDVSQMTAGPVMQPTDVLQGQMGIVDVEPAVALGAYQEQNTDMPQLVGASLANANAHIQSVGGPALSQYASHWGATHWGQ